jgi:hypothetical protein
MSRTENVVESIIESLFEKAEQSLAALRTDGYEPFFTTFAYNPDKQIIKVNTIGTKGQKFVNATSGIKSQKKNRVKSSFSKRSGLKRKKRSNASV